MQHNSEVFTPPGGEGCFDSGLSETGAAGAFLSETTTPLSTDATFTFCGIE